ncbi:MAG TPA: hypothetical protein VFW30_08855 [Bryocella sp.]|nr:hypothetical protein [Bryocella sp.]
MGNTKVSFKRHLTGVAVAILSTGLVLTSACSSPKLADAFVTIVPGNTTVGTGATFTMYTSASPKGVTWTMSKTTGCTGAACGTLSGATDTSVVYNAPLSMPSSSMTVTITATSKADSSMSASQTLTVYPVSVQISGPSNTTVVPLTTAVFNASVPGDLSNAGVSWTVTGASCAGTDEGCGSFRQSNPSQATFVAPPAPQFENVTVTATSIYAPGETASITLSIPKLAIYFYTPSVLPAAIALPAGKTANCQDDPPTYSATVQVFGNTKPYTFSFANLPSWICTPVQTGPSSFTLSGTPPAGTQGTVYPTVTVTDSSSPNPVISGQPFALTTYAAPPTGDSLLKGSYAFFATGWTDGSSVQTTYNGISYIGSFTADGKGNITGGELDVNDPSTGITSYSTLGGTYNIQYGLDKNKNPVPGYQTGIITLVPPGKPPFPITLAVSLSSIQNLNQDQTAPPNNVATQGHFVEFDDTTGIGTNVTADSSGVRAQGTMALQSPSVLDSAVNGATKDNPVTTPFTGNYAFGMAGYSAIQDTTVINNGVVTLAPCYAVHTCGPISLAGSMVFGQKGAITSGVEDVTVAENNGSAIALSGTVDNSGDTDASGRATASIMAAANSHMPDWPSNFAIYAVDPNTFYFMSIDPYSTNSLITGQAQHQNLADIASIPFGSQPLLLYGNVTSTTSFSQKGPNGQIRVELQLLTPAPTSPTAGKLSGFQWVNASGTYTPINPPGPGVVNAFSYTVDPATGRVTTSTTGEPYLYLVDTSMGFGTQYSAANNAAAGLFQFQPQTATTLNAGFYSYYVFNGTSQVAPMETGILQIPDGGVPDNATTVTIPSGTDYTSFGTLANVYQAGEPILYTGGITGTLTESGGLFSRSSTTGQIILPGLMQGCGQQSPQGGGWVISSTSFVCTPAGGSFAGVHVFQQ